MPQQQIDRLKRLHQLSLLVTEDYQTLYQAFLTAGVESLGLSLGIVSRIQGNDFEVLAAFPAQGNIRPGAHFPLGETYCHQVMRDDASIAVHRVAEDARFQSHPVYINLGVEAYISAPIHVKGEIFGTLNFSDTQPRAEPFSDEDVEFLELMAQSLGSQLERDLLEKERREAVRRMEENIALFEGSFQYSAVGMGIVSTDGKWLRVNQALCDLVGYRAAELVGKDFQSLTHPEDREEDRDCFNALVRDERQSYLRKKRYIHRNGALVWVKLVVSLVRDSDGRPRYFFGQIEDISARIRVEEALHQRQRQLEMANAELELLARTDSLTGLFNRREFMHQFHRELERTARHHRPLSLVLMDVDHFKSYNDQFGHPAGDEALATVANALIETSRREDFLARYGGEEFAVLLPETDTAAAQIAAERMRRAVAAIDTLKRPMTLSLGIVSYMPGSHDGGGQPKPEVLLQAADSGLYEAKANGRDRAVHAGEYRTARH